MSEVSLHPVHLTDSMERLLPAALIPICLYQASTSLLGLPGDKVTFEACGKFKSYQLEGQLCYSLDLKDIVIRGSKTGKENGLLIVLDPTTGSFEDNDSQNNKLARIYLHTLTPFTNSKNGSYALSVLKKMTGTASFMKMSDELKGCQVETYEECSSRKYLARVAEECGCVPWALSSSRREQVASQ